MPRSRQQAELALLNRASAEPAELTSTPTTPTKPTVAEPTAPKPIESKAPEKEEDPWKAIRGMGRADEIIADLESGGVMSFTELSGFFFNTPHFDDHTTELADGEPSTSLSVTLCEEWICRLIPFTAVCMSMKFATTSPSRLLLNNSLQRNEKAHRAVRACGAVNY